MSDIGQWNNIKNCPVCGKAFPVVWPHQWAYKRGYPKKYTFMCSYSCMREFDKRKEERTMKKITLEEKKKAVAIAIEGKNPLEYLKECGAKSPSGTWYHIKKDLKAKDPDRYMELPEKYRPAEKVTAAEAMQGMKDAADDFFGACEGMGLKVETPEKAVKAEIPEKAILPVSARPVWRTDFEISAVRNSLGEFYYDKKYNCIDWRTIEGDEVSMAPRAWLELIGILPDVMKVLGVDAE